MLKYLAITLAVLPLPVVAQDLAVDEAAVQQCFDGATGIDPDCIGQAADACQTATPDGSTTVGISECLMAETKAWDGILNSQYSATREQYSSDGLPEKLQAAQRAWIAFRDADCGFAYDKFGGGSMRGIASASCQLNHTARRALELKQMREP
ncbi:DUF1311 domain-containing protein [Paracoccus caeni]|uniref:DUF1311 domain-containing protein n=1 Tax=Paracoccus caeni TaxID=657651 RepID=A0A934VYB8_9RHOB|nr:lysozyme inhibitor LprI family protein [Paracoccus caeni]MBK4215837.1 DUF1311 domain-containing protein [Paracoccus caeni]